MTIHFHVGHVPVTFSIGKDRPEAIEEVLSAHWPGTL